MEEERFIGGWTRSGLAARSPEERHAIWKRARMLRSADGNQLAREIERLGLPYDQPGQLAPDDPLRARIAAVIDTPEARSGCIEATLDGLPAIAGVDLLLHETLGPGYRTQPEAVATAAEQVAVLMRGLGYVEAGSKTLPLRYVAREGVFWKRA